MSNDTPSVVIENDMTHASESSRQRRTRVVKVGGSLFRNSGFEQRLANWLDANPDYNHLLICGGGELVDVLRLWHKRHSLSGDAAHWGAVSLMDEVAKLLASLVPACRLIRLDPGSLELPQGNAIGLVSDFLRNRSGLPTDWQVTSDSLAAEIAAVFGNLELVLLKSSAPDSRDIKVWAASGYVDPYFPEAAASLPSVAAVDFSTGKLFLAN